jgi:hypothetical protein
MYKLEVLVLSLVLFFTGAPLASAASLYLDPSSGTYGPGDTFFVDVRVNNEDTCINAAQVMLSYPRETLKAVDFSRGASIFSLWIEEPFLDTENGVVRFAGGVPGGYCGRTSGDPALSNVLGRVVFTVLQNTAASASINILQSSEVLLHDGAGTKAPLTTHGANITIASSRMQTENPWLQQVHDDTIPPDPFTAIVESTRDVYGGKYYLVFSTVDKQSGIDHFELLERGAWKKVESPYALRDQFLRDDIQLKAIDKAGNERMAAYDPESVPERQWAWRDYAVGIAVLLFFLCALLYHFVRRKREAPLSSRA